MVIEIHMHVYFRCIKNENGEKDTKDRITEILNFGF